MPIFEYNGKKYNVRDEHIDSFMKDFPDASTIMEREGKKYRVKSADYRTFMSEQQQPEQSALDSTPETPVTPSAEEMPLTEQDKIRFSANIGQMKRRTEQMIDGFNERMETMREYHENAPLGGGQTAEGKMQFNPESGKLEKTYITPLGNRYTSKGLADMESFRYRQAADMSVNGQLRRAMLKLAELQEKREASAKRVHEQWEEDTKKNTAPLGFLLAADTYVPRQMSDKENSTLDVAIRQTEELIKDLEEQKDREQGIDVGFWRGFGRVAGDFRTWDFGMSDMRDALTMMNADDLKGENATEGEREAYNEMMGALYNKGQAEQMYGGNAGFWNRAGMMTGHMPAFMLDFGITGGGFKGINVLSKAGTKAATKVVGKETVEQMAKQGFKTYVKDNGVKGLGQYATNWTIKALGTTADDLLLRAPLMTNTVQAGKTTADIIDRKLGDVVVDENGNYDFSNDKTWGNAIWQGEANAIVENYSEMFGSHLDPVVTLGNMSKLANVVGAKRIGAVLSKTDAGALDGIMGQTHQLFNKMGVSDYFGEVTEEYYGQLWRTMLNLDDAYQQNPDGTRTNLLATGQFHGDIWGGMALSMGLMGAGKATLSGVQYASMKHGVNKADARATELLGKEIWEPLRATIDLTTNDDIGSVAEGIVNDKDFSDDERAAILTYMERSLMMRGFNLGTLAQKRGGEQDEDVQSMNESYIDGYNLADPQEMTDAKNMRDYQRQRVSAIVDENTLGFLDIHPMNALEEMRNNGLWGESELETVIDYLNAKQVYDGMIQRVRDDIDARVEQSNAMVDARTNRTSGMIQGATMKQDDRRVYVVGGNLVQYADGSGIDNRASDGSIIVRDAETGALEQVSPDAVLNIDEPLNPSDEKMTAEEAIIQQFAQEASDKIDGVVTFNPGDTYTITGDDAQIQVQIVANEDGIVDNGDGTVNVSDGVNIFPLAKETIQQQADAANLARVAQFEQQRTIENAERKQEMQEAERPQYALNDIVSLTDENGVTVRGNITADADADGKYEVFTEAPINGKRVNLFTRDELDKTRLDNLREQGFAQVTQQDATEPFDGDVRYDVVIANPPFGKREAVEYDGKKILGLDPQITLNALSSMKDDGRAAIIIGGNMEYANNGAIKSMKPFFTYLYDHYNVKGVIDMGGGLYAKQGTTFPTRMILIDGRRTNEERAQTAVYPPVENKAIRKAESFDDLYEIINEVLNFNEKTNGTEVLRSQGGRHLSVADNASGETDGAGHNRQSEADDESGSQTERRGRTGLEGNSESGQRPVLGKRGQNDTVGETGRGTDTIGKPSTDGRGLEQRTVGNEPQPVDGVDVQRIGLGLKGKPKKRDLTEEKLPYRPHNTAFRLESVAPAAMVEAMDKVLSQIEAQHGSIDEFVKTELGYDTIAETYQALAAEQMDSVAMAIYQMKQEQALIIGDQTGVGKGRQMAALIRWAVQRGEKPVFITQKADLFSDIYRDLVDVGSGDLVPFIFNSDGAMVDSKGNTVHKPLSSAEMAKVFASGALPEEYDFAVLTYSQVNTGDVVSQQEMEEAAKKSGARTKKSKNVKNGKATPKATFLRAIAKDNYLFLDESHTAAGSSNTGAYLQSILRGAKAATFASATFAKRPDTMPLYAIRTAMSQAKVDPDKMISIIEKGGVTLQEIMSRELTNAGQMVRRERDMSDVVTDWKTITDPETVRRARENYDRTIAAFNAIIKFQEDYVKPMIEALDMELAVMAESAGVKRGTDKMGVENVPFASKTYNYTKQLMLALKVNAIADEVEGEINAGRHPVIALESTMESSIKDYAAGEIIDEPTFSASLLKGLDTVMQYTVKDEDGNERHERYSPQALGPAGEKAYYELQDFIRESTSDIFISPLDAIIERLNKKGYKVGELTGRNMYVERNDDGRVVVKRRTDKDKKKMQREFNSGVLDVLILNKSASTGISLHASEKFSDQRQRSMIIAQPLSDINDYMQMIGRIDRTGQVHRGYYINLGLPVPAENRFLMMLSTKLRSLNANTTTSQDSESNDVEAPDLLNKYGSQVVVEYLRDNVDIYEKMGTPLKKGGLGGGRVQASELEDYKPQEDDARKITGYVALLATKEQEEFYDDVVRRYNELIKYLNDTGSNDLKITVMPLRATTIEKRISSEGIDPDGNNPFARNSFVEKVEMDVLRKPMKADEIRKVIEQINKGVEPNTYLDNVIETIRKEDEVRIAAEDERYEKSKAKAIDDIAKQTEKINGQKKRSDEEKRVAIDNFIAETNEKVEAKHKDNILRLNTNSDQMMRRLRMFEVGKSYLVPDNLESMIFDFATSAIFCGYKTKDSKITASTTLAVFATLDGRRRIEIKLSQIDALRSIDKVTNDNWDAARATTLDNWDSQIPSETRKTGFIMTGNILQAIADTQDEYGGYPGQLISYTDIDGNVHDGILMPDKWNASMLKTSGAPLSSRLQQIKDYTPITSHDGKVEIMGNSWAKMFYLTVPKTKKDGAVYYENKTLLRAAGGNFYPYRGKLRADIPEERIIEVVKELAKLGVKVKDDTTDILQRNGIGAYNDDEVSYENDPVAKLLGQSRRTAKQRREFARRERQRMAERVESLAEKLHLDNVEVVTDASVLDGKKQRAKGFYSKSTGKITIVIPNHTSTFDVEQTLLHEAVAHYGLRQLFGEHFDTFLDNVFNNADENIRRRIVDMAAKNGWDFHKATEEYLASLAEDTEFENINASWWQQIKDFFLNMLHKIGFEDFRGVTLSDNELRYILWRSYENLAEPGRYRNILGEAADVAKQYELKVGNYAVSDPHHQTVAESDDALYRTGDPEIHERELARDRYERRVKSGMFQSQEALQDSMLGLKEAMTAILGKETNIEDVDGFENAYLGENRLSSVNKAEADAFAHTLFKPMLDEVAKLARTEAEREELTDYMMAKHGLERNTYMRNEAINNGATDADQTDYAGLTALTGMDNVADAETEAQIMVNDYEQAHDTTDLWKKVNAASKAILSKSYECGMMSKATFDKISDMYDFYIPLRGFDEKTSSEAYAYLTHKQSAFNAPIKKAEGRRSKADDPFANLQSMAEGAIMQGNRNKLVKQRFLNFALNHPSDLVSVSDIWVEYDTVADEWKPVFPDNIDSTDTPEVVERKMLDFETKMESLAQQYPDRYKHGKDTVNIPYRIVESRDMRQHQIVVKRGGRDYVITINGNPRAAQALNGQTNPDNDMSGAIGAILRAGENINRQLSAFYTTRNPDFIVSNFMRDMLYTNTMTWIRESPNYALRFHRNYMYANPVRIKQLLAKHRKGTLDMSNKTEAMFHQFMMNGGETGYANIRDIEQHKNDIRRELKKSNGKIPVKKAWDLLGGRFDEYNRAVENCARFAAFMTSREMGRSIDRAIYDAKEISVNFNKKGSGAKFYDSTGQTKAGNASALVSGLGRSGYVFWNAAIQGTANFGRQMKRHPAKAFTGIAAMFLLGAIVAYLGGDDDDDDDKNAYYNLPEYVRRSNILFRAGNSWVSIPLPVEYRAVYGMGELMISVLNGKEHLTDGEIAEAITGQATQILPIDFLEGGGGLNAFVPSAYKPLWEAYVAEKSWTGMPLYKDTPYNKDMPEWTKAYKSANKYIVGLANAMNEATGGDPYTKGTIDFNPAKIEYMLNGYFGGVFGTIDKLSKMVETVTGNREYDPRSFLLANRLVKAGDERTEYRAVNNEYFRLKEEHDRLKSRLKHYEEDTDNDIFDYAEKIDFLYNSPEYERYEIFEDYREDIDDLYNELKEAISDEERKDIEAELNELKKEMIEEMNKTRK